MKLIGSILILLVSSWVMGQVPAAKNPPAAQPKAAAPASPAETPQTKPAEVTADSPVLTFSGICEKAATNAQDCKIVITRAQFETMVSALSAGRPLPPEYRRRFATQYAEMLMFADAAENRALEKDPETQVLLRFARMQVLAQRMLLSIQQDARPSPQEIQKYYDENSAKYQEISLQRVMIPVGHKPAETEADKQVLKTLADDTRKRLVAGDDPAKVEQEVYDKLGFKNPPPTAVALRASALPPNQQSLSKLKPGEVSEVFSEPRAFLIYKSEGEKPVPLDKVKAEIQGVLQQQKAKAAIDALKGDRKPLLNDSYFGPESAQTRHWEE